jgi:hypothetical protein
VIVYLSLMSYSCDETNESPLAHGDPRDD